MSHVDTGISAPKREEMSVPLLHVSARENSSRVPDDAVAVADIDRLEAPLVNTGVSSAIIPEAYAELTEPLLPSDAQVSAEVCHQVVTSADDATYEHAYHIETAVVQLRPQFIFVKVIKPSAGSSCGIAFKNRPEGGVIISRTSETGLFSRTDLQPGDRVWSVNRVSCLKATAQDVADLLKATKSTVSLMVRNKDGDPRLVSTCVQKPTPTTKAGIFLKNNRGAIHVTRLNPRGLLADSILTPGHRCISINGVSCTSLRSTQAAGFIADAKDFVTIVTEPASSEYAMVLSSEACEAHTRWWSGAAIATGAIAAVGYYVS